ncbi:hypothetical protein GCM10022289_24180 [Pedobacter jeongneungensis]|uniref:Uncharacterized protein n=1 Tax=Pedobacter jeongneungensis TaxID=947309 RepID=A0ABP8BEQ0_9SPHI
MFSGIIFVIIPPNPNKIVMTTFKKSILFTKTVLNFFGYLFNQSLNRDKLSKKSG